MIHLRLHSEKRNRMEWHCFLYFEFPTYTRIPFILHMYGIPSAHFVCVACLPARLHLNSLERGSIFQFSHSFIHSLTYYTMHRTCFLCHKILKRWEFIGESKILASLTRRRKKIHVGTCIHWRLQLNVRLGKKQMSMFTLYVHCAIPRIHTHPTLLLR